MNNTWTIANREFSDRCRSGWIWIGVLLWLAAIILTSLFGLVQVGRVGMQGYDRTVVSLLNLVQYFIPLLALLIGHDLFVGEREDRTLPLILVSGVSRSAFLLGKFLGASLTMAVPLAFGFLIAGSAIAAASGMAGLKAFLVLASSGTVLGLIFLALGLAASCFARSRVQAVVLSLLLWCGSVFAFDLIALGVLVAAKTPTAAQELEIICDPVHVNAAADPHAAFEKTISKETTTAKPADISASLGWVLWFNPVDLFRSVNLNRQTAGHWILGVSLCGFWIAAALSAGYWKIHSLDL